MKKDNNLLKLTLSALFLALAYIIPFFTGQIPKIGAMLCPMHMPVLLCGFLCGPLWGGAVGLIAPLFRSLTLGMPPLFPSAFCMGFELAVYGGTAGLLRRLLPAGKLYLYVSLLCAMIAGRLVWGALTFVCVGLTGGHFTFAAFLAGAVTNAIPGILIQILLVPVFVMLTEKPWFQKMRG